MNTFESRYNVSLVRRLQGLLILMIVWDIFTLLAELSFGSALFKISGEEIGGLVAGRGSFSGASLVTASIYLYALVRGPIKHRNVLWVGVVQQGAAAFFAVYHVATGHVALEGVILPFVVSLFFLVLLLLNMPRNQAVT